MCQRYPRKEEYGGMWTTLGKAGTILEQITQHNGTTSRLVVAHLAGAGPHQQSACLLAPCSTPNLEVPNAWAGNGCVSFAIILRWKSGLSEENTPEHYECCRFTRQPQEQPLGTVADRRQGFRKVASAHWLAGRRGRTELHGRCKPGGLVHDCWNIPRQRLR